MYKREEIAHDLSALLYHGIPVAPGRSLDRRRSFSGDQQVGSPGSRATVYNSFNALSQAGLAREISIDGKAALFDANLRRHHHFVCDHCGVVEDIEWFDAPKVSRSTLGARKIHEFEVVLRDLARDAARIVERRRFQMPAEALAQKHCVPCKGGTAALQGAPLQALASQVPQWTVVRDHQLERVFTFPDFVTALAFVNRIGEIAEAEGHHPDLELGWGRVAVKIYTHKVDGLTESDFILAAKIDALSSY